MITKTGRESKKQLRLLFVATQTPTYANMERMSTVRLERSDSDDDVELHSASHFQEQILAEGTGEGSDSGHGEHDMELSIDVCGAEDCCAIGSTTALLEIEELGMELSRVLNGASVKVNRSPCLGLCGKGPAAAISCKNHNHGPAQVLTETFSEVNGPEKCVQVINSAAKMCGHAPSERVSSSLLQRRADGMRWNALKSLGRHQRRSLGGNRSGLLPADEIEEALKAEERAARSCEEKERAERRAERLRTKLVESDVDPSTLFALASNKVKEAGAIMAIEPLRVLEKTPDVEA